MAKPDFISEKEMAALIRRSVGEPPLVLSFGPNGVFVNEKTPAWALNALAGMREVILEDGGGI